MSTYTQELAKRIREQNEIRDIYKERAQEAQTSYDTAVNTLKSGGDVYSLDDSARAMYRNIQAELARQNKEEQERLKKEREQMSGIERFGHTLGDFFGQGVGGLMKFGENTVDYFGTMFGADEDWVKRDWTQELFMDKLREGTKGSFLNDGKFGNMVQSSMFGLGNMLPSLALNAVPYVGGALSTASFMVNAAGGSTENALQNSASRDKALLYGTLSGISEGAIEKISGGIGGVGKGIVQSVGKSAVAKGLLGTAKKYTGRMIGEGLEEVASDVIDPLLRATYTGKVDYSDMSAGSLAETFGVGAMTSGLMLGGQAMAHNATAANRVRTKLGELNEVKTALDKRYYDGKLTEAQYKQGLSDINWLAEKTIKTMNRVSDRKAEKIVDKVGEKRLESAGIVQSNGKFNVNQPNVGTYNYKAMTPSLANKVDTLAYKPTSAELTAEQESLVKDYGKINNGKTSIVFTDDIGAVTEDGSKVSANGAYSDGVIYISRTAQNPLREVMKHEFTHALEGSKAYGKFASFVINEIQKSPVLQKEYGDFARTFIETAEQYKGVTADDMAVVSEIVAKYSERLFSDPKAINRLARANKGLARKVLGMVTDRLGALGKGKGTVEMRKFLRRAESFYRKAITAKPSVAIGTNGNTANEKDNATNIDENSNIIDDNQNKAKFSLAEDSNGVKYVKIDTEQNIFDGIAYENLGKVAKAYLREHFRGVEIDSIKINNTSVDEYTMSRNTQRLYSRESEAYTAKMKAATELDNFIKASIFNRREVAKHPKTFNKDGYDIYDINFEIDDKKFSGEMLIAVNGDKKLFYDITKIKKKMSPAIQVFPKGGGTSSSNNSISNSNTNVNNSAKESLKNDENSANINENSNIVDGKELTSKQFDLKESIKNLNAYSELERNRIFANKNNLIAEDYQSIIDFVADSKNDLRNKFLYIGKINSDIVLKIKNETGINVNDYSYVLNSEDIRHIFKNHSDNIKEAKTGQLAVTNSNVLDIIDTMLMPDGIRKEYNEKSGVVSIIFEKVINERLMAITVLSNDKKRLTLKSARIMKKRRIVSPSVQFTSSDKTSTSKTLRSLNSSNNSISNSNTNVNRTAKESLKNNENTLNIDENSNKDIKFSLKKPIEYKKNLIAVHNLSESKLLDSLTLGGFAMPSIAVLKADGDHNSFGDISVVFRPSAVDPQANADNKIYSADAYTPRFPKTEYSYNRQAMRDLADKLNTSVSMLEVNEFKSDNLDKIYSKFEKNNEVKQAFIASKGLKVVPVLHDPEFSHSIFNNSAIKEFLASGISFKDLVFNESVRGKLLDLILNKSEYRSINQKWADKINDELNDAENDKSIYEALEITYNKDIATAQNKADKVETPYSYSEGLSNLIEEHGEEYSAFVKALVAPVIDKKWLRNNKDFYTPSGNPRSFEQLHEEYTAENALRLMKELGAKNADGGIFGYGIGEIRAALSKTYDSIDAIHKDESRLKSFQDEAVEYERCTDMLSVIRGKIAELINLDNIYMANDIASNAILDIVRTKTDAQAKAIIKRDYTFELTDDILAEIRALVKDVEQLPVKYFEAKPRRVVNFDEIAAIVILSVKNASLVADKYANGKIIPESKKRKLLKLLNTFGLTFVEKELVSVILDYSPSSPKTIKQTIRHSSLTSEEKAYLLGKN